LPSGQQANAVITCPDHGARSRARQSFVFAADDA
jgi:hypothetical protein